MKISRANPQEMSSFHAQIQAANWVETEMLAKLPGEHWISLAQAADFFKGFFGVVGTYPLVMIH